MQTALIGFSGFVGGSIAKKKSFTDYYNSKNIDSIKGKKYDLIVSAGTASLKWKANLEPEEDWKKIQSLLDALKDVQVTNFILISTVDVYSNPQGVTEETPINLSDLTDAYGRNRFQMENFIKKQFGKYTFVRMPQTFGEGLKKNFIYDLIHKNALDYTHKNSMFQWYNLENLWHDIEVAIKESLPIINLAVEPISANEVAKYTLRIDFQTITEKPSLNYDMRSIYAKLYNKQGNYLYTKEKTLSELKKFIQSHI